MSLTNVNEPATGSVSLTGTPVVGQTFSVSNTLSDPDGIGAVTYTWYRDGQPIIQGGTLKDNINGIDGLNTPQNLMISSDQKHLYITGESSDSSVSWFERNIQLVHLAMYLLSKMMMLVCRDSNTPRFYIFSR